MTSYGLSCEALVSVNNDSLLHHKQTVAMNQNYLTHRHRLRVSNPFLTRNTVIPNLFSTTYDSSTRPITPSNSLIIR